MMTVFEFEERYGRWDTPYSEDDGYTECRICGDRIRGDSLYNVCDTCAHEKLEPELFLEFLLETGDIQNFMFGEHYKLDKYETFDCPKLDRNFASIYMEYADQDKALGTHSLQDEINEYMDYQSLWGEWKDWLGERG